MVRIWLATIGTSLVGGLAFWWGVRFGRVLLRKGATANDLFKGKTSVSLAFLGIYFTLLLLALYVPQLQALPLQWRVYGMQVTWAVIKTILLGACGIGFIVSYRTAPVQVIAVALIGILGLGGFTAVENYFLAPIHPFLENNLRPNGVFQQTSSSSCAPAAMATVVRLWGMDADESTVARLAGTSRLGTSMPQLIVAAHELGLDGVELSPTWQQMQQINRPGVLATWLLGDGGRSAHAVALLALDEKIATIADPAWGRIYRLSPTQLDRIWRKQYVPLFQPEDLSPIPAQTANYLYRLGYLEQPSPDQDLGSAIRRFQTDMGVDATGNLDKKTALLLTGPFVEDAPTLHSSSMVESTR